MGLVIDCDCFLIFIKWGKSNGNHIIFHQQVCVEDTEKLKGYITIYGGSISNSITADVTRVIIGVIEGVNICGFSTRVFIWWI